jgi:hypothetical protein
MPPYIITNIKATRPLVPSNELKLNETKATETADTVTGQHINSIPNTWNTVDAREEF